MICQLPRGRARADDDRVKLRRDIAAMLVTTFVTWMGQRATAVALPLVTLTETGSAWTTGLVGGAVGLPMLTSAWWARDLRQRLTTGRALACVLAVQVVGLLIVPIAGAIGRIGAGAPHRRRAGHRVRYRPERTGAAGSAVGPERRTRSQCRDEDARLAGLRPSQHLDPGPAPGRVGDHCRRTVETCCGLRRRAWVSPPPCW